MCILPFVDRFPHDLELYRIMTTKLGEVTEGGTEMSEKPKLNIQGRKGASPERPFSAEESPR